jgi:hypothetical protein
VSGLSLAPGRFGLLLLSLLLFLGGTAAAAGSDAERVVEVSLLALIIVAAVLDLRERGHRRSLAIALAGGVMLVSVVDLSVRIKHLPVLAGALVVLFASLVVWRTYTAVMRRQRSVRERIAGAICVYVLIGFAWAKVFETLDGVAPGTFRFPLDTEWVTPSPLRYRYFSLVTLATLGYGDVSPVTTLAGTLAWIEAITGQLYLAITVARLVALSVASAEST